ncbi:MAG: RpiB/LacA/LacB family sugar-phosphate isomerase [Actinomycetota bacterium]
MRVVAGADDASPTVEAALEHLRARGAEVEVVPKQDWPDVARLVAEAVAEGRADMGLVMCWTGTGTSMMANKVPGVRAALCWEPWIAEGARRWNDANVLAMSLKRTSPKDARAILDAWLSVPAPDADERANIEKLSGYERERSEPKGDTQD